MCAGAACMCVLLKPSWNPNLCFFNRKAGIMLDNNASSQLGPEDEKCWLVSSAPSHYLFFVHLLFLFIDFHYESWARLEDRASWKLTWGIKKKKSIHFQPAPRASSACGRMVVHASAKHGQWVPCPLAACSSIQPAMKLQPALKLSFTHSWRDWCQQGCWGEALDSTPCSFSKEWKVWV